MNTSRGGRNLILMGFSAIVIATVTTSVSLLIYRLTGDIYLDRSRPGYLPDEEEASEEVNETNFVYPDSGELDMHELDEYLRQYRKLDERLNKLTDPYGAGPLSDESLGITGDPKPPEGDGGENSEST